MKRVLVTGLTGFVGRHLYELFKENGIEIIAIVRQPDPSMKGVKWVVGDLVSDLNHIKEGLKPYIGTLDTLYHLAWKGVNAAVKNEFDIQSDNIFIANNIVEISKYVECDRFINSGTVAEYVCEDGLINDKCVPTPMDLYGVMKVASRNIIATECNKYGINMIGTIICSTYGEYRSDDNVVSYTIKTLLQNKAPEFGLLNQMWDFLYVKDVAKALFLIGEKGIYGKTYGIGSGRYKRLNEYIYDIHKFVGNNTEIKIGALKEKYKKVLNSCVDCYQIQKDTGFYPEYSFEEGIKRTIAFYKEEVNNG